MGVQQCERHGCAKEWVCKHSLKGVAVQRHGYANMVRAKVCVQRHGCASTVHANTWGCKGVGVQMRGCAKARLCKHGVWRGLGVSTRARVCVHMRVCVCLGVRPDACVCTCTHTREHRCAHSMGACKHGGASTGLHRGAGVGARVCVCTHVPGCLRVPHTRVHTCSHRHACAGECAGAHGQARTDARACVDTQMCTDVPADTRGCAHVNQPWGWAPPTPMRYQQLKISPTAASSHRHGNGRMGSGAGGAAAPQHPPPTVPNPRSARGGSEAP